MSTKWKKSVDFSLKRVQSSKKKWQQFSADSLIVVNDFKILNFDDLLRKYPTLSSFFWRDKGQLWKLTDEMKLINSNGNWLHQGNAWTITAEGSEGNIEDQTSGRVLGILNDAFDIGALVVLESKKRSVSSEGQKWLREVPNKSGWFRLKNPYSGKVLTAQNATITSITDRDIDFFEQCLNICMVQKEKFSPFLSYIEDLIRDEIFQFFDLSGFYDFIMTKAVEMKQVEHVQLLLDYFVCPDKKEKTISDKRQEFYNKNLKINSKYLIMACSHDDLDMVKVFIKQKCRLTTTPEQKEDKGWTLPNPLANPIVPPKSSNILKLLRMMATKSYILGCYQAMIETKGIKDCQCGPKQTVIPRGYDFETWRSESMFLQTGISQMKVKTYHECPISEDFRPDFMDCEDHVECNDPISRSFYLSRKTEEYARNNPEEGDECREIVNEYKNISFHLLDQCHNTNEAQLVLEDHTGKHKNNFRISDEIQ